MVVNISSTESIDRVYNYRLTNGNVVGFTLEAFSLAVPIVFPDEKSYQSFLLSAKLFIDAGKLVIGDTKVKELERKYEGNAKDEEERINNALDKDLTKIKGATGNLGVPAGLDIETALDKTGAVVQSTVGIDTTPKQNNKFGKNKKR